MVRLPDATHALVLIRRNVEAKINWWNNWDLRWEWERLTRLLRRDRRWRVEIYERVAEEPIELPREDAARVFVAEDKKAAARLAEHVAALLASGGTAAVDRGLLSQGPTSS